MNSHSDHTLHFEAVNSRNRAEVEHLEVFAEQSGFIESVTQCLQEADKLELWRPVGIYDRGMLIGFAMYGYFPEPAPGQVWLDRLLIDKKYQGKGYGKRVVLALLDRLRTEYSCDTIYLSVYDQLPRDPSLSADRFSLQWRVRYQRGACHGICFLTYCAVRVIIQGRIPSMYRASNSDRHRLSVYWPEK